MPPNAVTVADLPVELYALQAFALEQNRLSRVLWEQLDILQSDWTVEPCTLCRELRAPGGPSRAIRLRHGYPGTPGG